MKLMKLFLILIMASMIIPSVQALTVSQSRFTDGMTTTFASLEATPYIDVTVTGMNTATHRYVLSVLMGRNINDYPPELAGTYADTVSGTAYSANITSATNRVAFNPDDFPFEFSMQYYAITVSTYWKSNNTWDETVQTTGSFNLSGSDDPAIVYNINLANCLPENLNLGASPYLNTGISLDLFAIKSYNYSYNYTSIPVVYFITDNSSARHILGYGNGTLYYTHRGSVLTYAYGFKPIHRTSPYRLLLDRGYYFYVGVPIAGAYTLANTMVSCSDGSMFALDFSTNGYGILNVLKEEPVAGAWTYGNHYTGACSYFETSVGNTKQAVSYTVGTLGLMIRNWGDNTGGAGFGVVLSLFIAFLITAIFISIPFNISLRFHFKMPNYVYGVFIIVGVTANFGLGILELWQYGFFILCVALTVVVRFREEIGEVLETTEGMLQVKEPKPLTALEKEAKESGWKRRWQRGEAGTTRRVWSPLSQKTLNLMGSARTAKSPERKEMYAKMLSKRKDLTTRSLLSKAQARKEFLRRKESLDVKKKREFEKMEKKNRVKELIREGGTY